MVEFVAVLLPLLLVVVGIIQFGLLFGAQVSLTNAAREAAREATVFRYLLRDSSSVNGVERCTDAVDAAVAAFGFLADTSPHFSASRPCPTGVDMNSDGKHDLWQNGDVEIGFCAGSTAPGTDCPSASIGNYCTVDNGSGCLVRVQIAYNQSIVVPLLDQVLDGDGNGLVELRADASMVMN